MNNVHKTHPYLLSPQHPVTIALIGCGGNGSQMLMQLARIHTSLRKLEHLGLHVTCFDNDIISDANMGRQLFSPAEIGLNKSVALITRINRFFGTSWKAMPVLYNEAAPDTHSNIIISCVDSIKARVSIENTIKQFPKNNRPENTIRYWMDLGNSQNKGQFVLGTINETKNRLPTLFKKFPAMKKQKEIESGPSCSLAEALDKQDLFINSTLAQLAAGLLWKLFREGQIKYQGAFINLETLKIATINI